MKKLSTICLLSLLAISCRNNVKNTISEVPLAESSYTEDIDNADQAYHDSINVMGYKTDENGICEGLPKEYVAKNKLEKLLMTSFDDYYKAILRKDTETAKSYLSPKMFSIAKEKFPEHSEQEINDVVLTTLMQLSDMVDVLKERFEFYKKTVPMVAKLNKLPSKDGCFLYSVHYSLVILCTEDDKNHYAWHMPMFMYAASYDNGNKWYFIELVDDSNEMLKDFQ